MYKPVSSKVDFVKLEHEQLKFWEKADIFNKLRKKNENGPRWSFLDGPITANNPMGVHHAWGRTLKDVFNRYHGMLGHYMRYQNGFDCQGLWVEVEVEKELGFKSKTDIETYGVEKFVQACKDRVIKYSKVQTEQSKRLGYWMDWDNSYYTMSDENNYTIWHFLKKCHERGMIYKGHDVMPWCPRCGSAMSEHEIATEGYKELTHKTVFVKFYLKEKPDEALLVWTTTPWTLAANTAAAVNVEMDYVKVEAKVEAKAKVEYYYLAKELTNILTGDYKIVEELKGKDLLGLKYHGPFDELPAQKGVEHFVIAWDEVSDSDGTGIVHIAPGCGKEDFALSKENDIAIIAPIDEFGNYLENYDFLTGKNCQEVNSEIFDNLKEKGICYKIDQITHRYPTCWRHGTELVFRLVDEWFISMEPIREDMMKVVGQISWIPAWGYDREMDWLRNMGDWMISKKRYWGLSLPIWQCGECGHFEVIGGKEELKARAVAGWEEFEGHSPHKPHIDNIEIKCSKCGAKSKRIPDVGNPWLDAGIVPYSTMHYITDHDYWKQWFPADFITESLPGQFRNWFYSLLAMSTVLENTAPFKTVLGHALVKDETGKDMHKSAGNAIPFHDAADHMGVDVMRWMYTAHNPEYNLNFGYGPADEIRKKMLTLWNMYSFYVTYADIDRYDPTKQKVAYTKLNELDKWALAKIHAFIKEAREDYDSFRVERLMRKFEMLLEEMSNWYVRRSRRRFWKSGNDIDKMGAYYTLYNILRTMISVLAPILPFVTEDIYQNLVLSVDKKAPQSVHLQEFPVADESLIDTELLDKIDIIIKAVEMGRSARNKANIRTRQPLANMLFKAKSEKEKGYILELADQIKEELNIKNITLVDDIRDYVEYEAKPNFVTLGKKIGKQMPLAIKGLKEMDGETVAAAVQRGEALMVNGISIDPADIQIAMREKEHIVAVEDRGYVAILDIRISEELKAEGLVRDLVRHIQTLRKEADFNVDDRIALNLKSPDSLTEALELNRDYLLGETLAEFAEISEQESEIRKEINVGNEIIIVNIKRI
ncbi:MAG: isoleucine--tRNA ligase [bacterium]|jgi:isoleucyl-tRNA synthetase|nr:isoleucine--tRNA ligase [bacterium]